MYELRRAGAASPLRRDGIAVEGWVGGWGGGGGVEGRRAGARASTVFVERLASERFEGSERVVVVEWGGRYLKRRRQPRRRIEPWACGGVGDGVGAGVNTGRADARSLPGYDGSASVTVNGIEVY